MLAINNETQTGIWQSNFPATPSTTTIGTLVTANTTIHTKGAYTSLLTTTFDVFGFWLRINNTFASGTNTSMLLDIALGASQQNIIVPDFPCGWGSFSAYYFPIFIPRGTLISARLQSLISADTASIEIVCNGGSSACPGPLFSGCDTYGANTATSAGVSHTPGNTGAESTPTNVGGTTTKNYGAVLISCQGTQTVTTQIAYHFELVVGSVTVCEWYIQTTTSEIVSAPHPPIPFLCSIPAGTQLQVRAEASGTAQALTVAFHCFY